MRRNSDRPSIDELARRLAESLPAGLRSMREELEQNFRSVLRSGLDRLDLVTREEFEVQRLVLERTREKLEALSARFEELEHASPPKTSAKKKAARRKTKRSKSGSGESRSSGDDTGQ